MARHFCPIAIVCFLFHPNISFGEDAKELFDSVYGAKYARVLASPGIEDDIELATQLIDTAAAANKNAPEFQRLLFERAFELTSNSPRGYHIATRAMKVLAKAQPDLAAECTDRLVTLEESAFRSARGDKRIDRGNQLIIACLDSAKLHENKNNANAAFAMYRKAIATAASIKSPRRAEIESAYELAKFRQTTLAKLDSLKRKLRNNPDHATAEQIATLLIVDLNDPKSAAVFADELGDSKVAKYVKIANQPMESLSASDCLLIGEWLHAQALKAPKIITQSLRHRTKEYYKQYLLTHKEQDLNRKRVELLVQQLENNGQTKPDRPKTGQWIEILPLANPAESVRGSWQRRGKYIAVTSPKNSRYAILRLPVKPNGDYQVEIQYTIKGGWSREVATQLPLRKQACWINTGVGAKYADLVQVHGKHFRMSSPAVKFGVRYTLLASVRSLSSDRVHIVATVNNKTVMNWTGPRSSISRARPQSVIPNDVWAIGAVKNDVVFHSAKLKMLTGKAEMLRSK